MAAARSIATRNSGGTRRHRWWRVGVTSIAEMTGPQRAAVILLVLGEDHGRAIWQEFDDEEIRIITRAMAELGTVDSDEVERLMLDFVGKLSSAGAVTGSFDRTISLLEKILPSDQVALIMEEIRGPGRAQHVAEARQYRCRRARELPEERIPADASRSSSRRSGRSMRRTCCATCRTTSRSRSSAGCCAGIGAEGSARPHREHAAHRVRRDADPDAPARSARDDGGDLQRLRPPDRNPFPVGARCVQPGIGRAHPRADVHLRGSRPSSTRPRCRP